MTISRRTISCGGVLLAREPAELRGCALIDPPSSPLVRLYLERRADLVRVFASRLNSHARAEDLVQAMFEKVAAVSADQPIGSPVAFLYRLGANLMLDDIRQDRRRGLRDRAWSDLQGSGAGDAWASDAPGAHQTLEARQRLQRLLKAVETLPPQTRRAFRMHKLEGMSHAQTATALGVSKSAVEKHISLALKLLAERTT